MLEEKKAELRAFGQKLYEMRSGKNLTQMQLADSKEDYERAQLIIQSKGIRTKCKAHNDDLLAGKVRCGCCGHLLQFWDDTHLYCQHTVDVGTHSKCNKDTYDALKIRSVVLSSLRKQIDLMSDLTCEIREQASKLLPDEKNSLEAMKKRIQCLNDDLVRQYENYVNGNLHRDGFKVIKEEIILKRAKLECEISEIEEHRENSAKALFDAERIVNLGAGLKQYRITRDVLDALVDEIYIGSKGEVKIKFKFEDIYLEALNMLRKDKGEGPLDS